MSDELKPALTAEEWRRQMRNPYHAFLVNFGRCGCGVPRIVNLYDPSVEPKQSHKLAALALHGQPFGFTREDVKDEGQAYHDAVVAARHAGDRGDEEERQRLKEMARRHLHRADRIEALLPPEDTQ